MKIIFGTNTFRLLHKKPSELGLDKKHDTEFTIERHQEYFHFFWIPVFSLGQQWAVKKPNDKTLYELSQEFKNQLQPYPLIKTPWYTYFLPIALLASTLIFILFLIYQHISLAQVRKDSNDFYYEYQKGFINKGYPDTYISLRDNKSFNITLKVLSSSETHLLCALSSWQEHPTAILTYQNKCAYAFLPDSIENLKIDTVSVSKAALMDAYNPDFYTPVTTITIGKYSNLRMDGSIYLDMPIFDILNIKYTDSTFCATLKNIHTPCTFLTIKTDTSAYKHNSLDSINTTALPKNLNFQDTFYIRASMEEKSSYYKAYIHYKSRYNRKDSLVFTFSEGNTSIDYPYIALDKIDAK